MVSIDISILVGALLGVCCVCLCVRETPGTSWFVDVIARHALAMCMAAPSVVLNGFGGGYWINIFIEDLHAKARARARTRCVYVCARATSSKKWRRAYVECVRVCAREEVMQFATTYATQS